LPFIDLNHPFLLKGDDLYSKLPDDWQSKLLPLLKRDDIEKDVLVVIGFFIYFIEKIINGKNSVLRAALARAMKIVPSSESEKLEEKKDRKKGPQTPEERIKYHEDKAAYHKNQTNKIKQKKRSEERRKKMKQKKQSGESNDSVDTDDDIDANIDDDIDDEMEMTEEELEQEKKETREHYELLEKSLAEKSEEKIESASIDILSSPMPTSIKCEIEVPVLDAPEGATYRTATVTTTRFDVSILVREITCIKEIKTDTETDQHYAADMSFIGPKGSRFTWNAIVTVILFVLGTAIPMRRIERLLGKGVFRVPNMVKMMADFAWKYLPVYLYDAKCLANAAFIAGDDTSVRVNEVTRWKRMSLKAKARDKEATVDKPWENAIAKSYKNGVPSLVDTLRNEFGLEFEYAKDRKAPGNKDKKACLQTTVTTALIDTKDPYSRVVLYRTHFGSFGNFLGSLLTRRSENNNKLIIQGDMSSANRAVNPPSWLEIVYAGCAAHARRPFKRFFEQDPDLCSAMLSCFRMIFSFEHDLDDAGRNATNVVAVRKNIVKAYWEEVFDFAKISLDKWSNLTPLGKAIRYVLKWQTELTMYLSEPRVPPDNNMVENLCRFEAMEDNSSFGRASLEGRARFDIGRSALATCSVAGVEPRILICFTLMKEDGAGKKNPECYTCRALKRWLTLPVESVALLKAEELRAYAVALKARAVTDTDFS
jgi:hypothetical protein